MLEGLEISEVNISEVRKSFDDFRIHSEAFSGNFEKAKNISAHTKLVLLRDVATIADGDHAKFPSNQPSEIRYLQAKDISKGFLELESEIFVSSSYFQKNQRSKIIPETILMSIMGNVGDVAITSKDFLPAMANRAIAIIREIHSISPQYLFASILGKYVSLQLKRLKNGGVQQRINLDVLGQLKIPLASSVLQGNIEKIVLNAEDLKKKSKNAYAAAETILLETLGLINFTPSAEAINIKSFKSSFGTSGRLDAEYYQPKYEDWIQSISRYKQGSSIIANTCQLKDKNFMPEDNKTYSYIELSDIDKVGGITGATVALGSELPTRARRLVKAGDVLISSIEGSLSSCAIVSEKYNNALCSTGFYVIRSDKINAETLLIMMKSKPLQALLKQGCSGTILTAINNEAFLSLPVPLIDSTTQQKIAASLQESFKLKAESERLLEVAKRAVEVAIEQNEEAGLAYIEKQT